MAAREKRTASDGESRPSEVDALRDMAFSMENEAALDFIDEHESDLAADPGIIDVSIRFAHVLLHDPESTGEHLAHLRARYSEVKAS